MSETTKKYYAEWCPYGRRTISDGDTLYAFPSKKSRDTWVHVRWEYYNALTAQEARSIYGDIAMQLADTPGSHIYETYDGLVSMHRKH